MNLPSVFKLKNQTKSVSREFKHQQSTVTAYVPACQQILGVVDRGGYPPCPELWF